MVVLAPDPDERASAVAFLLEYEAACRRHGMRIGYDRGLRLVRSHEGEIVSQVDGLMECAGLSKDSVATFSFRLGRTLTGRD